MKKLVIAGTIAFDTIETPRQKREAILGGSVPYVSLAAQALGLSPGVVSVTGDDFEPEYLDFLRKKGIDTAGIQCIAGEKTFCWHARYLDNMDERVTLESHPNVFSDFEPRVPESYQGCECLVLASFMPSSQIKVIESFRERPRFIMLDTITGWIEHHHAHLMEAIAMSELLIVNQYEAMQMTGAGAFRQGAEILLEKFPHLFLIVKRGSNGSVLVHRNEGIIRFNEIPSIAPSCLVDPTGAGDSYAGTLAAYLCCKGDFTPQSILEGMLWGAGVASFTIEAFGVERLGTLTFKEVSDRRDKAEIKTKQITR